jgi:hypothetical protein
LKNEPRVNFQPGSKYFVTPDTTLKSVQLFTLPTGIQLCDSFGVAARVASPAVQVIVATKGMALVYSAHVLVPAQVSKGNLSRYNFQIREHNWW